VHTVGHHPRTHQSGIGKQAAAARALQLLEQVRITDPHDVMGRYPHQLSGGMAQRVMIALALAQDPALLVADEPTTALDVTVQAEILVLLRQLCNELSLSILLITHDLGVVAELADRVAVMYAGQIVEEGTVSTSSPSTPPVHRRWPPRCRATEGRGHPGAARGTVPTRALASGCRFAGLRTCRRRVPRGQFPTGGRRASRCGACRRTAAHRCPEERLMAGPLPSWWNSRRQRRVPQPRRWALASSPRQPRLLEIRRGETLGLVGESGSGKTTLGRALLGLGPLETGAIRLDGVDLASLGRPLPASVRKRVQAVFQDPLQALNPRHRVERIVGEPLRLHTTLSGGALHTRVIALLEQVGLSASHLRRRTNELSGGQRQRVAIARALAVARGAVLDEAVNARRHHRRTDPQIARTGAAGAGVPPCSFPRHRPVRSV
jgi:ABC-type glutathione transport system ATPase component